MLLLQKIISGVLSEFQTFWIQIRADILLVLIWPKLFVKIIRTSTDETYTCSFNQNDKDVYRGSYMSTHRLNLIICSGRDKIRDLPSILKLFNVLYTIYHMALKLQ